jgi:dimethylaniline monooxygenase (N-oxide forming)
MPRYAADGSVFDRSQSLMVFRIQLFMLQWFPTAYSWLMDKFLARLSAKSFPGIPESWRFSPAPPFSIHPPLIADEIFPLFKSGFAEPVTAIKRVIGPRSLELQDGRVLSDVDAIIFCTGYDTIVPFIDDEYNPYPVIGKPPKLYRGIFPLHVDPEIRTSLAFLGHGAFNLVGFIQAELCQMAISQIWLGRSALPPYQEMKQWHRDWIKWRQDQESRQTTKVSFLSGFLSAADQFPWLDKTAGTGILEHFSWFSFKSWIFWWRNKKFYQLCHTGLFSPALVRLFDTGKRKAWPQAREQIYRDNEDVAQGQQEQLKKLKRE